VPIIRKAILVFACLLPATLAASPAFAAAPRHYDCSKAGNANKVACKGVPASAPAAATLSRTTTTGATTTTTTRHYDCTKRGNANKAACRSAGAQTPSGRSPGAVKTTTTTTSSTTDCTKWYNRMRAACRTSSASSRPRTTVAPAPKPQGAPSPAARSAKSGENGNAAGATAQCRDGTYSHAVHHSGACSHHGGVAKWLG
jgi:hypothetical protein